MKSPSIWQLLHLLEGIQRSDDPVSNKQVIFCGGVPTSSRATSAWLRVMLRSSSFLELLWDNAMLGTKAVGILLSICGNYDYIYIYLQCINIQCKIIIYIYSVYIYLIRYIYIWQTKYTYNERKEKQKHSTYYKHV